MEENSPPIQQRPEPTESTTVNQEFPFNPPITNIPTTPQLPNRIMPLLIIGIILVLTFLSGSYYIFTQRKAVNTSIPSTVITPTTDPRDFVENPEEPAYVPGKGFSPDALRVIHIGTLQIGLERYRVAKGYFPSKLEDILPEFAPMYDGKPLQSIPVDPETKIPYEYVVTNNGLSYELSANTSGTKKYTVTEIEDN
jgi:hypothetical protein